MQAYAQLSFTEKLQRKVSGQGVVVLHHDDATISKMINGSVRTASAPVVSKIGSSTRPKSDEKAKDSTHPKADSALKTSRTQTDTLRLSDSIQPVKPRHRYKANGYRIQIYAGGNSRSARTEAERWGMKSRSYFPELPVYTHFYSPRWICRVGDFKTMAEASQYLQQFKQTKLFGEAYIVKSQIFVYY